MGGKQFIEVTFPVKKVSDILEGKEYPPRPHISTLCLISAQNSRKFLGCIIHRFDGSSSDNEPVHLSLPMLFAWYNQGGIRLITKRRTTLGRDGRSQK